MIDNAYVLDVIGTNLENNIKSFSELITGSDTAFAQIGNISETIRSLNINDFAMTDNIVFHDRQALYMHNSNKRDKDALEIGRKIATAIGLESGLSLSLPVYSALSGVSQLQVLLEVLFVAVMLLLLFLSIILIYSLMLTDVNERTFEFGMLRALGLKRLSIIGLVLIQALIFIFPGVLISLAISYLLNLVMYMVIFKYTNSYMSFDLPWEAIVLGVCIGTFLPILSNTMPIQRALSQGLRDALNLYHHTISDVYINIVKLENMGTSLIQAAIGAVLAICGALAYYLVPYSLVYGDFRLFFYVMIMILMGMVLGKVWVYYRINHYYACFIPIP